MSSDNLEGKLLVGMIFLIVAGAFIFIGPKGCSRRVDSWKAEAYGSNWVVVQHAQDGSVMYSWVLQNKSIGSERDSDGIYFTDDGGNVVHLSGHYVYMQCKGSPDKVLKAYMEGRTASKTIPAEEE